MADRKNSFEREISEEIRKGGLPSGVGHATGFYVPWDIVIDPAAVRRKTESRFRAGTTLTTTTTGQEKNWSSPRRERSSSTFTARWSVESRQYEVLMDSRRNVGTGETNRESGGIVGRGESGVDVASQHGPASSPPA